MLLRHFVLITALTATPYAFSQEGNDEDHVEKFVSSLHFQTGKVAIPKALATLNLTSDFQYLGPKDAQKVLEELWGNPPDEDVLGLLVPNSAPLTHEDSWAVAITYSEDGYVSDEEASKIDYTKMLKEMQQETRDDNAARKKAGYEKVELVGWATQPHYDKASNKLYWAKELRFGDSKENTLNYDIRVLGRGGYLSLNAIADVKQLGTIEKEMQKVITMAEFDNGNRYADFNPTTDKVATYGIAALVGGALAAKTGLLTKLLALLIAGKKVIFVGLAAVGAGIAKLFGRKKQN